MAITTTTTIISTSVKPARGVFMLRVPNIVKHVCVA
jgi:hypothetical protein